MTNAMRGTKIHPQQAVECEIFSCGKKHAILFFHRICEKSLCFSHAPVEKKSLPHQSNFHFSTYFSSTPSPATLFLF